MHLRGEDTFSQQSWGRKALSSASASRGQQFPAKEERLLCLEPPLGEPPHFPLLAPRYTTGLRIQTHQESSLTWIRWHF
jgi:hypothetical protein